MEKSSFLSGQTLVVPKSKRGPDARNLKFLDFRARTSGTETLTNGSNFLNCILGSQFFFFLFLLFFNDVPFGSKVFGSCI